jgi:spermidine synthase/MFS family permease
VSTVLSADRSTFTVTRLPTASAAGNAALVARLGLISVLASAALLILQQLSFRLLAPVIGSSVETWSTIIGVFLLGIALGNLAGGQLADRGRELRTIRWCTVLGGLATLGMLWVVAYLKQSLLLADMPLATQIGIASLAVCFLPSFILSLLTPLAIKAVLRECSQAGRVTGLIFALGTIGSLVGNYLAGFVLIPLFNIHTIVILVAVGLFALSLLTRGSITAADGRNKTLSRPAEIAAEPQSQPGDLAGRFALACTVVFVCSFVSGTLESAAFRMLAPLVGMSIYLATGVVGVILAGMSAGNYLGGWLADQRPRLATLRACLITSALATLLVAPLLRNALGWPALNALPLIPKIVSWSFLLMFLPALALGTISPQVIRLLVTDVGQAGRISGRIYAWSTLGCVAGILATGWLLIEWLGVQRLVVVCGLSLIPLAIAAGPMPFTAWLRAHPRVSLGFLAAAALIAALFRSPYDLETRYFSIAVLDHQTEGRAVKRLVLDRLVHSEVDLADPNWLCYKHEQIQGDFTRAIAQQASSQDASPRLLVIGGGGYTLPRWIEHQPDLASVEIEVVEIDPGVTRIAHRKLGLPAETRIVSHHLDGRQFLKSAGEQHYHLIVQDAVNDFSVPYHLMTTEYNALVRRSLQPDGVYLLTVIDSLTNGPFLRAAVRTMQATFPEVKVLSPTGNWQDHTRAVYVIAGFSTKLDARADEGSAEGESSPNAIPPSPLAQFFAAQATHVLPADRLREILAADGPRGIVLTDGFAPVDTLMVRNYLDHEQSKP